MTPPRVNIGHGLIRLGLMDISINEKGPCSTGCTNSAGLPIGSGNPAAAAELWASTVARSPAGSTPALAATSSKVEAETRSVRNMASICRR